MEHKPTRNRARNESGCPIRTYSSPAVITAEVVLAEGHLRAPGLHDWTRSVVRPYQFGPKAEGVTLCGSSERGKVLASTLPHRNVLLRPGVDVECFVPWTEEPNGTQVFESIELAVADTEGYILHYRPRGCASTPSLTGG